MIKNIYQEDPLNNRPQVSDLMDLVEYAELNVETLETPRFFKCFMRTRKNKFFMSVYLVNALKAADEQAAERALGRAEGELMAATTPLKLTCEKVLSYLTGN